MQFPVPDTWQVVLGYGLRAVVVLMVTGAALGFFGWLVTEIRGNVS